MDEYIPEPLDGVSWMRDDGAWINFDRTRPQRRQGKDCMHGMGVRITDRSLRGECDSGDNLSDCCQHIRDCFA